MLPLNSGVRCPCADPVLRILGALPITAAALNALARGEATVVPNEPPGAALMLLGMLTATGPLPIAKWQETYAAMLAASPYAAEE